jgi:hypothetical protein
MLKIEEPQYRYHIWNIVGIQCIGQNSKNYSCYGGWVVAMNFVNLEHFHPISAHKQTKEHLKNIFHCGHRSWWGEQVGTILIREVL